MIIGYQYPYHKANLPFLFLCKGNRTVTVVPFLLSHKRSNAHPTGKHAPAWRTMLSGFYWTPDLLSCWISFGVKIPVDQSSDGPWIRFCFPFDLRPIERHQQSPIHRVKEAGVPSRFYCLRRWPSSGKSPSSLISLQSPCANCANSI